ncbi:hypothetical protein B0H13DRAFT_1960496 [Mycena leptocephala]|nr:hypothetical protein B0H13DRAFT_2063501 [Mycena leptocephala]KAJ7930867.1 hypothetical protein B0H13DRAFT_1960496 [Mycena leptocephala]
MGKHGLGVGLSWAATNSLNPTRTIPPQFRCPVAVVWVFVVVMSTALGFIAAKSMPFIPGSVVVSAGRRGYHTGIHPTISVDQDDGNHPPPVPVAVRVIQPAFAVVVVIRLDDDWPEDEYGERTPEEKEGAEGYDDEGFEAEEQARSGGDGVECTLGC